jgi:inorganic pyrophosphatase
LDAETATCWAVIESTKGRRSKFVYDIKKQTFELAGLLPEGMSFPLDYGFIPSTLAEDGDPVDILVLADEPAFAGALLKVRVIGVVEAEQAKSRRAVRNDRIVGVSVLSRLYESITAIDDLGDAFLGDLQQFWVNYNDLKGRAFEVKAVRGAKRACRLIARHSV